MHRAPSWYQANWSMALAEDAALRGGPGLILLGVFETLERAGIPYCVLHGYDDYPWRIKSDVDCMISADVRPLALTALLQKNCDPHWSRRCPFQRLRAHFVGQEHGRLAVLSQVGHGCGLRA